MISWCIYSLKGMCPLSVGLTTVAVVVVEIQGEISPLGESWW
jgi:hypothetical protein